MLVYPHQVFYEISPNLPQPPRLDVSLPLTPQKYFMRFDHFPQVSTDLNRISKLTLVHL